MERGYAKICTGLGKTILMYDHENGEGEPVKACTVQDLE
jgi:hypothetical protein